MLLNFTLGPEAPAIGSPLRLIDFPAGALVLAIRRQGETVSPEADTVLHAGDLVTVMARPEQGAQLRAMLEEAAPH